MWFQKKRQEETKLCQSMERLSQGLGEIKEKNEDISRQQQADAQVMERLEQAVSGIWEQIEGLKERQKEQEKQIRRQSGSFEDLLEEIQERRQEQEEFGRERKAFFQKEQALLALVACCREQMGLLKRQIAGDGSMEEDRRNAWLQQFEVMDQETARLMRPCGLEEAGIQGEAADYDIHEVLSVVETEEESKANTVAEVYARGLLSGGHPVRKAKVAVYRLRAGEGFL